MVLVLDHAPNDRRHQRVRRAANPAEQPGMRVHDARRLTSDRSA